MSEVGNPHDRFFRQMFSRPDLAREFVEHLLPTAWTKTFDLNTVRLVNGSFVDDDLREHLSDMIYQVDLRPTAKMRKAITAQVYVLIEHKSQPDRWVVFQLLRSMVQLWDQERKAGATTLSPILPVIVYHGRRKWSAPAGIRDLLPAGLAEELRAQTVDVPIQYINLQQREFEQLQASLLFRGVLQVLREVFLPRHDEWLTEAFSLFAARNEPDRLEVFQAILVYLTKTVQVTEREIYTAVKKVEGYDFSQVKSKFVHKWIREGLEKGRSEGRQVGREEGLQAGQRLLLAKLITSRFGGISKALQTQLDALPADQLDALGVALFDLQSLKDLKIWLAEHSADE